MSRSLTRREEMTQANGHRLCGSAVHQEALISLTEQVEQVSCVECQ